MENPELYLDLDINPASLAEDVPNLLKIGFLYDHSFGRRVINHLINKDNFCKRCGPLCINGRLVYPWFAGKIHYAHYIDWKNTEDAEICLEEIEEKLSALDVMVIIGVPEEILMEIPALLQRFNIRAAIFPVEDGKWISSRQQLTLQNELHQASIQYSFPRPFCTLIPLDSPDKSIINEFIDQFHIGRPIIELSTKNKRIMKTHIARSAPCGATFYIAQHLRNEQLNTWNTDPLEKRISTALEQYPCIAARSRDPAIQMITRIKAENIAHETMDEAFENAEQTD